MEEVPFEEGTGEGGSAEAEGTVAETDAPGITVEGMSDDGEGQRHWDTAHPIRQHPQSAFE